MTTGRRSSRVPWWRRSILVRLVRLARLARPHARRASQARRPWFEALRVPAASAIALCFLFLACAPLACRREAAVTAFDHDLTLGGVTVEASHLNAGAVAFTHYCRACHGAAGDGGGPSALGLRPPPRDLRLGVYKFAAVAAGQLPNDADFRRIIRGGLHGTAMLAWDLPDRELEDVIAYIKTFSARWLTEKPGDPIVLDPDPWAARPQPGVSRGERVYHGLAQCAVACHPAYVSRPEIVAFTEELTKLRVQDFRADLYSSVAKPSDFGLPILPPDFTFNRLRAGEAVPDIARTIAAGIGGTAMPTWKGVLPDADIWAMAHYVNALVSLRDTPEATARRARLQGAPPWTPPAPVAP